jgi:hypothetical protein
VTAAVRDEHDIPELGEVRPELALLADLLAAAVILDDEALWTEATPGAPPVGAEAVDAIVDGIVAASPDNIHFVALARLATTRDAPSPRETGIWRDDGRFRNAIYARVFGPGGPLDLRGDESARS